MFKSLNEIPPLYTLYTCFLNFIYVYTTFIMYLIMDIYAYICYKNAGKGVQGCTRINSFYVQLFFNNFEKLYNFWS